MKLWELLPKQSATIIDLQNASESWRLEALGFRIGEEVFCLHSTIFSGPKIYQVGDQIVSLSQEIATHINVTPHTSAL